MLKVLIVDDDIATVEVIRDSISWKELGIGQVCTAYDVASAKTVMESVNIDIVVSDIEMPRESGLDLLRWVRQSEQRCEFLLLTCHEDFSFAASALNYEAAAYLTKPFDIAIMEMNLRKAAGKIIQNRIQEENSQYGEWIKSNLRTVRLDFWKQLMNGEVGAERKWIAAEIEKRHLEIDAQVRWRFVYTKVSNEENDLERFGKNLLEFIQEGFHSEIISGEILNENVIKTGRDDMIGFLTVSREGNEILQKRCEQLISTCADYFEATVTCCISDFYELEQIYEAKVKIGHLFNYNIAFQGQVFAEHEALLPNKNRLQILDLSRLTELVAKKEKTSVLRYIRSVFKELEQYRDLNVHSLYLMKQELIQVVYAELAGYGIQATKLFYDELSIRIEGKAETSTVDMIRWINYLLDKTFQYEEQVLKSQTLVDKVNEYIRGHYMEAIGRNEIAGEFFLTPEYLAKVYKKKTGVNLKDYINKYRVEKAQEQLRSGSRNISDIAEAVGFDNFSYFSTVFKKYTGVTPKEYRVNP